MIFILQRTKQITTQKNISGNFLNLLRIQIQNNTNHANIDFLAQCNHAKYSYFPQNSIIACYTFEWSLNCPQCTTVLPERARFWKTRVFTRRIKFNLISKNKTFPKNLLLKTWVRKHAGYVLTCWPVPYKNLTRADICWKRKIS